jgi:hypothetical protein
MDDLDKFFIGHALAGIMTHARTDNDADVIAQHAVLFGRATAAAYRKAEQGGDTPAQGDAPKPKLAKPRG